MGVVNRLSAEEEAEMVDLYGRGLSLNFIADKSGRSLSAVLHALRRHGVTIRGRGGTHHFLPQSEIERTVELYLHGGLGGFGMTLDEVAAVIGRAPSTIWDRLRQAGAMRSRVETAAMLRRRRGQSLEGLPQRAPRLRVPDREQVPKVAVEPFRNWLKTERMKYERLKDLAVVIGMDDSHIGHILEGRQSSISLDIVDRALTRMGIPLWQVYPDLYPDVVPPGELEEAA